MDIRNRALWVIVFIAFAFTLVSLRLVQIQAVDRERYEEEAVRNHLVHVSIPARRGSVTDANGAVIAQTRVLYNVRVDGREFKHPEVQLPALAAELGMPLDAIKAKVHPDKRYELIREDVPEEVVARLKELKCRALIFEDKMVRSYPNGALASHVIGFMDGSLHGISGVERAMDKDLRGFAGERWFERDARRREIAAYRRKDVPPVDGLDVRLTLDLSIQHIVEEELDRLQEKYHPTAIYAIVMRPKTGDILAMANRPTFDPNKRDGLKIADARNRCLTDTMEPGSTFKIVTMAGGLQEQLITLDTPIFCENGVFYYGGKNLHDHEAYGMLKTRDVMMKSSNIGFAKIALEMGEDLLYNYARLFGFGQRTQMLSGQGESGGLLYPVAKWSKLSITRIPMGHEVAATPIQMITAVSAIANGGRLVTPRLVRDVVDTQGRVVREFSPKIVRQIVSESVARQVSEAMASVVSEKGTAPKAAVPGFSVAGKTGTAAKFVNGAYSKEKYLASFFGYLPAENPEFSVIVMVDEPKGREIYGGQVAAPAFSSIAAQIAQNMNLVPRSVRPEIVREASL